VKVPLQLTKKLWSNLSELGKQHGLQLSSVTIKENAIRIEYNSLEAITLDLLLDLHESFASRLGVEESALVIRASNSHLKVVVVSKL